MPSAILQPNFAHGFARSAGESAYPELWKDLIGAWVPNFGNTGNKLFDFSGRSNHGDSWLGGPPIWDAGRSVLFEFSNEDRIVATPNIPAIGTGNYTLLMRIFKNSTQTGGVFAFDTYNPSFEIRSTGEIVVFDGAYKTNSTGTIALNTITDIAVVRRGTGTDETEYYIDGVSAGTCTHADSIAAPLAITLGADRNVSGSWGLDGNIYHTYLYTKAKSTNEIYYLSNNPYRIFEPAINLARFFVAGAPPSSVLPVGTLSLLGVGK